MSTVNTPLLDIVLTDINRKMYHLVQFIDDGIIHMCENKKLKNKSNCKLAQWHDGHFYRAKVLWTSKNEQELDILKSFHQNILNGFPIVILQKFLNDCELLSSSEKDFDSDDSVQDPNFVDSGDDESSDGYSSNNARSSGKDCRILVLF